MFGGAWFTQGPFRVRAEYIDGSDVRGVEDWDEQAWFVEGSYRFNDLVEGVVRFQDAECDDCEGTPGHDTNIDVFEVGINLFLGPTDRNGRVQLNYVSTGGDEEAYGGAAATTHHRYDAILAQVQLMF